MKTTSRLLAAGLLLVASACQDGVTMPSYDGVADARSATKTSTDVRIRVENSAPDGLITYSVRVRSSSRTLSSFQGRVLFAAGSFALTSQTTSSVSGGVIMVNVSNLTTGQIRFAAYTQSNFDASGEGIEVFRFVARRVGSGDPALSGVLDVIGTTSNGTTSAGSGGIANAVAAQACSGTSLWGDGNADGIVNITDAQQLARYSAGLVVGNWTAVTTRGDVTADGNVNIVDAQQIARYSVGLSSAPRTSTWIC